MNAKDAIRSSANLSKMVLNAYISDLEDADLMRRPGEGCNHLAWQLGHLISAEAQILGMIVPGSEAGVTQDFAAAHAKDTCGCDDAAKFHGKQTYSEMFESVRAATSAVLDSYPETDLDKPAPEDFREFCPTVGDMFMLIAMHPLMHAGQFAVVRRQLGKPILM